MNEFPNTGPAPKSIESLKTEYKTRLENILNAKLTVYNIDDFADVATLDTISLLTDLHSVVLENPQLLSVDDTLVGKDREDAIFKLLDLPDIEEVLGQIQATADIVAETESIFQIEKSDIVVTEANSNHVRISGEGGNFEEKKMLPRLKLLLYILRSDFDVDVSDPEQITIVEGRVTSEMMRKTPYFRVNVPSLERVAYVCDEEGNASYVFDTLILEQSGVSQDVLDTYSKDKKNQLIQDAPGVGVRLIQSDSLRVRLAKYLSQELPKVMVSNEDKESESPVSEFRKRVPFLGVEEFKIEVANEWNKAVESNGLDIKNFDVWYRSVAGNHPDWPLNYRTVYREEGLTSNAILTGRDQRGPKRKRERTPFPSFDQYKSEVLKAWQQMSAEEQSDVTSVIRWYKEQVHTRLDWPVTPEVTYKDKGWKSYPELVGRQPQMGRPKRDQKKEEGSD